MKTILANRINARIGVVVGIAIGIVMGTAISEANRSSKARPELASMPPKPAAASDIEAEYLHRNLSAA
jgi:hypothetical protein